MQSLREVRAGIRQINLSDRLTFLRNLAFIHNVIVASENLLAVAVERSSGDLQAYYTEHLREERQHEKWLAADLASADIDISALPISTEAVAMAGAQYYLIYHVDPVALLGYMAVLECFPMPADQLAQLEAAHGEALCRTMRYHATHDVQHGADVLQQIDRLDGQQFELVMQNAIQTELYIGSAIAKF